MSLDEHRPLFSERQSSSQRELEAGNESRELLLVTRREWIGEKLESNRFHKAIIFLISVDAACVLADLVYTFLADPCAHSDEEDPVWLEVLSHISIAITTFFLLEIPLASYAFGLKYYRPLGPVPHASLHLFDAVVILTTFVLEVVLKGREQELVGLLVLLRLWRLVKLVGGAKDLVKCAPMRDDAINFLGIAVGAGEIEEELSKQLAETNQELQDKRDLIAVMERENNDLRRRLASTIENSKFR